jgi:hypothetical protein
MGKMLVCLGFGADRFHGVLHAQVLETIKESSLFINPLLTLYWTFELDAVARRILYRTRIYPCEKRWRGSVSVTFILLTFRSLSIIVIL